VEAKIVTHKFKKGPVEVKISITATYDIEEEKEKVIISEVKFLRIEAAGAYWPPKHFSQSVTVILHKHNLRHPVEVLVNQKRQEVPFF
jgi:hypothetical protein